MTDASTTDTSEPKTIPTETTTSRALHKLTAAQVAKLKEPGFYSDGGGLYLRVTSAASRAWVYRYRVNGRKTPRDMGLGPLADVSLAKAREKAAELRKTKLGGDDPIANRKADKAAKVLAEARNMTFEMFAQQYHDEHRSAWTERHADDWIGSLKKHAYPVIGKTSIPEITPAKVKRLLDPIWTVSRVTAQRVRARIELVLDAAKAHGLREGDNPAAMEGNLRYMLPAKAKTDQIEHYKDMPYAEIAAFMKALRAKEGATYRATELLILTASRSINVLHAKWPEINFEKRTWTIDARHMKNSLEHVVYLSDPAVALLREMEKGRSGLLIFPGRKRDQPLSSRIFRDVFAELGITGYDVHGLRGTFSTWANETTPYKERVIEASLAHGNPDKVAGAYNHATFSNWRIKLMADWAAWCGAPST